MNALFSLESKMECDQNQLMQLRRKVRTVNNSYLKRQSICRGANERNAQKH